jgi:S-adenosyl methyltransferase
MAATPPGSFLALSHPASDIAAVMMSKAATRLNRLMSQRVTLRARQEVSSFFDGLVLAEPGMVQPPRWRQPAPCLDLTFRSGAAWRANSQPLIWPADPAGNPAGSAPPRATPGPTLPGPAPRNAC